MNRRWKFPRHTHLNTENVTGDPPARSTILASEPQGKGKYNQMKQSIRWTLALVGTLGLLVPLNARAQTMPNALPPIASVQPQPNIPVTPATIFPINQPSTFRYSDAQGLGSITLVDLGLDRGTGFDLFGVRIAQNGRTFSGSGIATPIPGATGVMRDLVSFTITGPNGDAFFYEGKMGLGVEFQGQGTFHPVNDPTQNMTWNLLFVAGTPPPGPQSTTLSLSLDRGCGSVYLPGTPMVITYSASVDDTLTLLNQRSDGTFTIFANQPVRGGQTYSISTFAGSQAGPRTLILMDSAGVRTTCTFTGLNNR